jgi:hypothetical protein
MGSNISCTKLESLHHDIELTKHQGLCPRNEQYSFPQLGQDQAWRSSLKVNYSALDEPRPADL